MSALAAERSSHPLLRMPFFYKFSSLRKTQDKLLETLHGFTDRVIQQRRRELLMESDDIQNENSEIGIKRKYALLDVLLKSQINDRSLTGSEIREEVDTFMFEVLLLT